jgi:hypothetical protein
MDRRLDEQVDAALADTFPASDPPFFMGSTAVAGSPHAAARDDDNKRRSRVKMQRGRSRNENKRR